MNTAMAFLETLGSDRSLASNEAELTAAATAAGLSPALIDAIARRDRQQLESLLGARHNLICAVFPVDPGKQGDEEAPDEVPDEQPQQRRVA